MSKFHINSAGEVRRCSAFTGNCPYGNDSDHYSSEGEGYEAIAKANEGNTFNTFTKDSELGEDVKVRRRDKETLAATSSDPKVLYSIASDMGHPLFGTGRKIAKALASNPNTPGSVLVEARSHTDHAWAEYVDLEQHPNYPITNFTEEGATYFINTNDPEAVAEVLRSDDVGDRFVLIAGMYDSKGVLDALANGSNKPSLRGRGRQAVRKPEYSAAAAKSGRFPTSNDIQGKTLYYQRSESGKSSFRPVSTSTLITAAAHTPNEKTQRELLAKKLPTEEAMRMRKALLENPKLAADVKETVASELKAYAQDLLKLAST